MKKRMVNVCVPTLNRYDKLSILVKSLYKSTIIPDIFVIDNGRKIHENLPKGIIDKITIFSPGKNIGVASSWNWFIKNVPEIRIICNDDIIFHENSIEKYLHYYSDEILIYPNIGFANAFSCFSFPDKMLETVGFFDEEISPGYAYFEDNDFAYRMKLVGTEGKAIEDITVDHVKSSTVSVFTSAERKEHHKRFRIARDNYVKKWGGTPGNETYLTPYNT